MINYLLTSIFFFFFKQREGITGCIPQELGHVMEYFIASNRIRHKFGARFR